MRRCPWAFEYCLRYNKRMKCKSLYLLSKMVLPLNMGFLHLFRFFCFYELSTQSYRHVELMPSSIMTSRHLYPWCIAAMATDGTKFLLCPKFWRFCSEKHKITVRNQKCNLYTCTLMCHSCKEFFDVRFW